MATEVDAEAIDALLVAAFGDVQQPPREALINPHCEECLETSEALADKPWQAINLADLEAGRETSLLTAAAWRYYLPAIIRWSMRERDDESFLRDNVVYALAPQEPEAFPGQRQYFEERASGFDARQRQAIVAFLEWYRGKQEAEWGRLGAKPPDHVYKALAHWTQTP
jgi:hypothetical protein